MWVQEQDGREVTGRDQGASLPALPCGAGAGPAQVSFVMSQCQVSLEGTGGPGESKGLASLGFQASVFSFPGKTARFH